MLNIRTLLLGLLLALASPLAAFAQCSGQAPASTYCGNPTGALALPGWKPFSGIPFPSIAGGTVVGNRGTTSAAASALTNPILGIPGTSTGQIGLAGATSGTVTILPQAAAGTYNFNLPTGAGTAGQPLLSGGGGAAAQTYGTLQVPAGGTGLISGTSGGVLYFNSGTTLASSALLAANQLVLGGGAGTAPATLGSLGTTTTVLHGNAAGAPTFGAVSLTADVSGILPLANGGTAANLTASNGGIVYSTASALAILSGTATAGQIIRSGSSAAPSWSTATYPSTASAGTILAAGSANVISATATPTLGANGGTGGQITLSGSTSGTGIIQVAAAAGSGIIFQLPSSNGSNGNVLTTNGSGVTAWSGAGAGTVTSITCAASLTCTASNPITGTGTIALNVGNANSWTAAQTFDSSAAKIKGSSTGVTSLASANSGASNFTITFPAITATATVTIASGAKALATGAISSATCTSAQTDTATGTLTTDAIIATFSADPSATTGYAPVTTGMLTIEAYPTADTVNFKVCNITANSITPGAVTINWRVVR